MNRPLTRAAFALAIVAFATASLTSPAKSSTPLLEIYNKTNFELRFTVQKDGIGPLSPFALAPGQKMAWNQTGWWYFAGDLAKAGKDGTDLKLQDVAIMLKSGERMAHILAVDDSVAKRLRWYLYYL